MSDSKRTPHWTHCCRGDSVNLSPQAQLSKFAGWYPLPFARFSINALNLKHINPNNSNGSPRSPNNKTIWNKILLNRRSWYDDCTSSINNVQLNKHKWKVVQTPTHGFVRHHKNQIGVLTRDVSLALSRKAAQAADFPTCFWKITWSWPGHYAIIHVSRYLEQIQNCSTALSSGKRSGPNTDPCGTP